MNKVYIIFPLIGLLIFGSFYYSFDKSYSAKLAAIKASIEDAKKAKLHQQEIDRQNAYKAATEASALRKKEKEERDRIDEAKKTARQEAEDLRQRTYDDRNKFRDQVSRLKKELEDVKSTFAKINDDKKHYADEDAFLKTYVKQAESNAKYYYDLLDKVAAAEKASADAAAAAAAAAKKNS
jgi:hypothetical protein